MLITYKCLEHGVLNTQLPFPVVWSALLTLKANLSNISVHVYKAVYIMICLM